MGDGYSITWRVFDAQYWGVPQRRRRIALVADFNGQCAGEILFKRNGLSRNFTESCKAWQGIAGNLTQGIGETGKSCIAFEPGIAKREGADSRFTEECTPTLRANMGDNQVAVAYQKEDRIVLDDQDGSQINVGYNKAPTLRAETHGNLPCVMENKFSAGFCTEHSAQARGIGYEEGKSPTLRAGVVPAAIMIENHPADSRVKIDESGSCQTLTSRMGTGGGNVPLVMQLSNEPQQIPPVTMQIRCGKEGGGKGPLLQYDKSATLGCNNIQTLFQPVQKDLYRMATQQGGAEIMNDLAPTITAAAGMSGNNQPIINQQKSVEYRNSGFAEYVESDSCSTLKAAGGDFGGGSETLILEDCHQEPITIHGNNVAGTLKARDYKGVGRWDSLGSCVCIPEPPEYIVRRLTPLECSRLQGFPDWWCDGLQNENPNGYDIAFWREVFETHRKIVTGASKPKTDKQIIKWLKEEPNDSAMYKMWGNGIALPCFLYVVEGIKEVLERTS